MSSGPRAIKSSVRRPAGDLFYTDPMPADSFASIRRELKKYADSEKAKILAGFFKTGKGQYGYGDRFLGVTVPLSRAVAFRHKNAGFTTVARLFRSPFHEERLVAILLLVHRFQNEPKNQKRIFAFYLKHARYINNWDLVDLSADKIVGRYLRENKRGMTLLKRLARSDNLWERRIAILSTFHFIKEGEIRPAFAIACMLICDKHDLIHKAAGWMLREAGKRVSKRKLETFLKTNAGRMPRTMLRYAIEHFPERERKRYLKN